MASDHAVPVRKWLRPLILGVGVAGAVFALSRATVFQPAAPSAAGVVLGDAYNGETVFQQQCAGCHGAGGTGGSGPALAGSGLAPADVQARIEQGGGVMPAGLVEGQKLADVLAYVDRISAG